ncbi:DUF3313 domain-containing protein [Ulvibacterium marinum]|uniref:DUF3313 domain-containing protein n=1 Tax=Ulvibacterium marinum TaxID=2419782 RepID=A0A3B0C8V5_9FLAO|nr:DUF3313 domain-containing protein [Ulvibacterium marinum]RKN81191.1 DUF3313 domain-containing protein [Ulvibacterium marinum]
MKKLQKSMNLMAKALSFIFMIILVSCTATKSPSNSGFLEDYSRLRADQNGDRSMQWWEKKDFNWSQYRKIILDPVILYYHTEAKGKKIDPEKEKKLTDYFRNAVEKKLANEYPIVITPGPDVLRIRTAITEIIPASPAINYPAMAVAFFPIDMGGAVIEVEFLDSETNEVIATMVDKKMGSPFKPRAFSRMGYTRAAFDGWAKELRIALDTNP